MKKLMTLVLIIALLIGIPLPAAVAKELDYASKYDFNDILSYFFDYSSETEIKFDSTIEISLKKNSIVIHEKVGREEITKFEIPCYREQQKAFIVYMIENGDEILKFASIFNSINEGKNVWMYSIYVNMYDNEDNLINNWGVEIASDKEGNLSDIWGIVDDIHSMMTSD